jgi:hypothetical protein
MGIDWPAIAEWPDHLRWINSRLQLHVNFLNGYLMAHLVAHAYVFCVPMSRDNGDDPLNNRTDSAP